MLTQEQEEARGQQDTRPVAIYGLVDIESNIRYVGKSVNPHGRFKAHKRRFKYVIEGLALTILEWVPAGTRWQEREKYWVEHFGHAANEYGGLENKTSGGEPGAMERIYSQQRNAKISVALTGRKRPEIGPAISRALKGKYKGIKQTPQAIEARIAPLRNRKRPRELVERIVAIRTANGSYALSESTRSKMSKTRTGVPKSQAWHESRARGIMLAKITEALFA